MPRPPLLPTIDWAAVFDSGKDYVEWLAAVERPERRQRMEDNFESLALEPHVEGFLAALPRAVHVVAIAEDWCGDVVRHAPVLARLEQAAPNLKVRFITREQRPDVFIRFLTNGGEAIPKFIFLSDQFVECGSWGPMADALREIISRGKAMSDVGAARQITSALYQADASRRVVVSDLMRLIDIASTTVL